MSVIKSLSKTTDQFPVAKKLHTDLRLANGEGFRPSPWLHGGYFLTRPNQASSSAVICIGLSPFTSFHGPLTVGADCNVPSNVIVSILDNGNGGRNFRQRRQAFCDFLISAANQSHFELRSLSTVFDCGLQIALDIKKRPGTWPGLWCVFSFGYSTKLLCHGSSVLLRLV